MKLKIFSIYDKATNNFNTPYFLLTTAEAIRAFEAVVVSDDNIIKQNPLDFSLHILGEFDNITGQVNQETAGPVIEATQILEKINSRNVVPMTKGVSENA